MITAHTFCPRIRAAIGNWPVISMPQCDNCMDDIDVDTDARVEVVKPMEFKGEVQEVTQYYCTIECLIEKIRG